MNIADNVQETTTGTSAAVIVLGGAAAGFKSFDAAFDVGATDIPVRMEDDAGNWESSWFTLTNATTLTRTAIADSSNGGAATVFSAGSKDVFCTPHVGVFARLARDDAAVLSDLGDPAAVSLFVKTAAGIRLIPLSAAGITGLQLPTASTMPTDASLSYTKADGTDGRITFANLQAQLGGTTTPGDTTAPTFSSAQVANGAPDVIVVTFNETLGAFTPAASAFTVSGGKSVSSVARTGATVSLTVNSAYANGDTITVQYVKPGTNPLQDAAGNQVASFGPSSVTNNIAPAGSTVSGVTVSPSTTTVAGGATQQFTATVAGTNSPSQGVTWAANGGSINSSGLFTAPAATGSAQTITVTATSQQDGSKAGTATVTVPAAVQTSYTYTPYNSNVVKTSVLTSTGTTSGGYRYYFGTDAFNNAYWNVSPTPTSMVGGWGDSPTTPPATITSTQNSASNKLNGMIPLNKASGQSWNVSEPLLWALDGAAGPFYFWMQPIDGAPYCLNPSAAAYVVVG